MEPSFYRGARRKSQPPPAGAEPCARPREAPLLCALTPACAGDILFLYMGSAPVRVGEIVVFNIAGRRAPVGAVRLVRLTEYSHAPFSSRSALRAERFL